MQPLAFGSYRNWRHLVRESGGVDPSFRRRAAFVTAVSLATAPLRVADRLGRRDRVVPDGVPPPLFVVGHWRSGTTYLHNLLCEDPQFGFVTAFQTLAPEATRVGRGSLRPLMAWRMPPTRVVDEMAQSIDGPIEEEWAMANMSPYSPYHHFTFPRRFGHFMRYALMVDVPPHEVRAWQSLYASVVARATALAPGRRLVLKNPANTGRLPALLALFPEALVVHIVRSPYDVFASTLRLYDTLYGIAAMHPVPRAEVEENILSSYAAIQGKFLADRETLGAGRLVEVRYEDLAAAPLEVLGRVYEALVLPGFGRAEPHLRRHAEATARHVVRTHGAPPALAARVRERWRFAFEAWRYPENGAP